MWLGNKKNVDVYVNEDIYKTIPKSRKKYIKAIINYEGPIEAPINKNDVVGSFKIYYKDDLLNQYDLLASENVKRLNIFLRILNSINYLIWGDV